MPKLLRLNDNPKGNLMEESAMGDASPKNLKGLDNILMKKPGVSGFATPTSANAANRRKIEDHDLRKTEKERKN